MRRTRHSRGTILAALAVAGLALSGTATNVTANQSEAFEEVEFWKAARYMWGQFAGPKNVQLFHEDVTCDGRADYVGGYFSTVNPDMDSFDVLVVTRGPNGTEEAIVQIPVGEDTQFSLMDGPYATVPADLAVEQMPRDAVAAMAGEEACPVALAVDDGMTGTIRLFWRQGSVDGEDRLTLFRN